jgi:hypothetical protein
MANDKEYSLEGKTVTQKIKYFASYYWKIAVGVILGIALLVFLLQPLSDRVKYNAYCLLLNDTENDDLAEHIKTGFPKFLNDENYFIDVDKTDYDFIYLEEEGINWPERGASTKLMVRNAARADVVISDYNTLLWAAYTGFIFPVDEILPADLLARLEPYFVYARFQDEGSEEKVYGLDISNTEVFKPHSGNYKDGVVSIPKAIDKNETGIQFVKYLFGVE